MAPALPRAAPSLPALALALLLCWAGPAAAIPLLLPEGEPAERWRTALSLGAARDLSLSQGREPGQAWVELQRTADPERWRLRVRDERGTLHEVEVPIPLSERDREGLVALAVSLLHPLPSAGGDLWDGLSAVEEPPPPPPGPPLPEPIADIASGQGPAAAPAAALRRPPPSPAVPEPSPAVPEPSPGVPEPSPAVPEPSPGVPEPSPGVPEPSAEIASATGPDVTLATDTSPPPLAPGTEAAASGPSESPPPALPLTPAGTRIFTRLLGVLDAGLGAATHVAPGGGVQVGALLPRSLRLGVGFQLEGIRDLSHPLQSPERYAEQREADAHATLLWSPDWRVSPLAAVRVGVCVRTVYQASLQDDGYVRRVVSYDEAGEALGPFPIAGLDLGLSFAAGPALRLQPYAQLQLDVTGPWQLELFEDQWVALPRTSLHVGLALHLEPHARAE